MKKKFNHRKYQQVIWAVNGVLALFLLVCELIRRSYR